MRSPPPTVQTDPADQMPGDTDLVTAARARLGILDFEFFRAAWRHWHGAEPEDRRLEPAFVTYLFHQRAPGYVRHFARRVLEDAAAGRLDPLALGLDHRVRHEAIPDLCEGFSAVTVASAVLLLFLMML